jgi:hypothetical protein
MPDTIAEIFKNEHFYRYMFNIYIYIVRIMIILHYIYSTMNLS